MPVDQSPPAARATGFPDMIVSRDLFGMILRLGQLGALFYLSFTLMQLFIPIVIWSARWR